MGLCSTPLALLLVIAWDVEALVVGRPQQGVGRALPASALTSSSGEESTSMAEVYDSLAKRVVGAREARGLSQYWVGCAGGPGAGKSTVAAGVARSCEALGVRAVVLPMDGYHFSREQLRKKDPPDGVRYLARRGAPHTFDAEAFVRDLRKAKAQGRASLPTYSRELSDPVPDAVPLADTDEVVLVEGNYLLLGFLAEEEEDDVREEARRWKGLLCDKGNDLFDETWFVYPRGGVDEQRTRLVQRHLETWTDAKTAAWDATSPEDGATKRTDFNDLPNAKLVERTRPFADLQIETS